MNNSNLKRMVFAFSILLILLLLFSTKVKFSQKEPLTGVIVYQREGIIRAPFDGYVNRKFFDRNEIVSSGEPVLAVYSIDSLKTDLHGNSNIEAKINSTRQQALDNEKSYIISKNLIINNIEKVKKNIDNEAENKTQLEEILKLNKELLEMKIIRTSKDKQLLSSGVLTQKNYENQISDLLTVRNRYYESKLSINRSLNELDNLTSELINQNHKLEELEISYLTKKEKLSEQLVAYSNNKDLVLKSPQDGLFIDTQFDTSKQFNHGDLLARVVSEEMIAKLIVDNESKAKIKEGDVIEISVTALPYDTYGFLKGVVSKISDISSNSSTTTQEVEVNIDVTGRISRSMLTNGMSVIGYADYEETSILRLLLLPLTNSANKNFEIEL